MDTASIREADPVSTHGNNLLTPEALHSHFLEILPRVETHARIYFRHLRWPGKKADAIAETVAVAWVWFLRLTERGKDVDGFVGTLASLAARHVRSGRRLCGQERLRDVLSPLAQQRKGFAVVPLPARSALASNVFDEALRDNVRTPVPDQVHFRVEVPPWLASLGDRRRSIAIDLMRGEGTGDVAGKYGLTAGRVSQMRSELRLDWQRFQGEPAFA